MVYVQIPSEARPRLQILRRVPEGEHNVIAMRRLGEEMYLIWEGSVRIRDVAEFYYQDTGNQVSHLDVGIHDVSGKVVTHPAAKAANILLAPRVKKIEFREDAHAAG